MPGRPAAPTPRGLAMALDLPSPADDSAAAALLPEMATIMLRHLAAGRGLPLNRDAAMLAAQGPALVERLRNASEGGLPALRAVGEALPGAEPADARGDGARADEGDAAAGIGDGADLLGEVADPLGVEAAVGRGQDVRADLDDPGLRGQHDLVTDQIHGHRRLPPRADSGRFAGPGPAHAVRRAPARAAFCRLL